MKRFLLALCIGFFALPASAQTTTVTMSLQDSDFTIAPVFNDVRTFSFTVELNETVRTGLFDNPEIINITYRVQGTLTNATPSGAPAFDLQRSISGADFYAQGSSLAFNVVDTAILEDGIQVSELDAMGVVFRLDAFESDTGRFHPPVLELNLDGTGRIQNSNNLVSVMPPSQVAAGDEYVTDLSFIPAELTVLAQTAAVIPPENDTEVSALGFTGGGAFGLVFVAMLAGLGGR
ncbi:MAG: hypothetical protein AAGF46_06085, partial [Pseudomonadota bacterium]